MLLREVNGVLDPNGKAELAEEFVSKLINFTKIDDGVKMEKLIKMKKNCKDLRKDVQEIKQGEEFY